MSGKTPKCGGRSVGGCQRNTSWACLPSSPGGREQRLCPWRRRANRQEGFGHTGTATPGEEPNPITSLVPNGHIKGPNPLIFWTQKTSCPSLSLSGGCLPSGNTSESLRVIGPCRPPTTDHTFTIIIVSIGGGSGDLGLNGTHSQREKMTHSQQKTPNDAAATPNHKRSQGSHDAATDLPGARE